MESPAVETAATNAVGCMASDNSCFSPGARKTAPTRIDDTTASSSFTALSSAVAAEPAPAPPAPPMDAITEAADSTPSVRCMLKSPTYALPLLTVACLRACCWSWRGYAVPAIPDDMMTIIL